MPDDSKFEKEELPKILVALKTAKDAGHGGEVKIKFSDQGGVLAIVYEGIKRFK